MISLITIFLIVAILVYRSMKLDSNLLLTFYDLFSPNKDKLTGKIVWIVGSSTGIGEALVYQLAKLNCKLILTSTNEEKLEQVKQRCLDRSDNKLKPDDILLIAYDISDYKKNDVAFQEILNKFGRIDIVLNNAARLMVSKIGESDDFNPILKMYEINLFANMYIAQLAVQYWTSRKLNGLIMVSSSLGTHFDLPYHSAYLNTKRALNGFYADLSLQKHKDGIQVCIACIGPVNTEIDKHMIGNRRYVKDYKDKIMSAERCAELMIIAMANRLYLSWICIQPALMFTYIADMFGYQFHYLFKIFNLVKFIDKNIQINK